MSMGLEFQLLVVDTHVDALQTPWILLKKSATPLEAEKRVMDVFKPPEKWLAAHQP